MPHPATPLAHLSFPHLLPHIKTACSTCGLRELCLPVGLTPLEIESLDELVERRRSLKRGEYLHRNGAPFHALFAVRQGFFKTSVLHEDGREQVTGFQMSGELLGMDAISSERHTCDAVALEPAEVCEVPFAKLEEISRHIPTLMNHFHKIMSREIVRDHGVMLLLGSMSAEERLTAFLLNLSHRFSTRGGSSSAFQLRMTREDIGNYLGLKLETVSRAFSKLQADGLIKISNKHIEIRDPNGLRKIIGNEFTGR